MQSLIIIGNKDSQKSYLDQFVLEHSIRPYALKSFSGTIKIADVHAVVRYSNFIKGSNENHLILFDGQLTIPAQNALLKFLEELADNIYVIFRVASKEALLDTIISRSKIVTLGNAHTVDDDLFEFHAEKRGYLDNLYLASESISNADDYEKFILKMRNTIIHQISSKQIKDLNMYVRMMSQLHERFVFVKENNVNAKLSFETIDLSSDQSHL